MSLTREQSIAVGQIKTFLKSTKKEFVFTGPPGSGKTFTIKYALNEEPLESVYYAAVSHAAKNVLLDAICTESNREFYQKKIITVAQLIGSVLSINSKSGKMEFVRSPNIKPPIREAQIVVIDECSMIDGRLRQEIIKLSQVKAKIIWMGDSYQLPPVTEARDDESMFDITENVMLTNSIRFDNYLKIIADYYRKYIDYAKTIKSEKYISMENVKNFRPHIVDEKNDIVYVQNRKDFMDRAIYQFTKFPHTTRILAYRNEEIDSINYFLRSLFYPYENSLLTKGEQLILNAPYRFGAHDGYYNGEILDVLDATTEVYDLRYRTYNSSKKMQEFSRNIFIIELLVKRPTEHANNAKEIRILSHESTSVFEEILEEIKESAQRHNKELWKSYYTIKSTFADWSYTYAISTHKAQGQSLDNVLVLGDDIMSVKRTGNMTKLKSLYVAVTRAKKRLTVLL